MEPRIGYLTPEFPGQTHAFIWRERQFLREVGIQTDIVSTRRPPKGIMSQSWAQEAEATTAYLTPFGIADGVAGIVELLRAGPVAWSRCLAEIFKAEGLSAQQRLKMLAIAFIATKLVRLSRTQGWSHIHVHSCAEAAHLALFASKLSHLTYSLAFLGPVLEIYGPNQANKWKNSQFAVVMSNLMLADVQHKIGTALPAQVEIASMGVDTDIFRRANPYEPWQSDRPCRIYSCGRLNPVKGHKYLIAAIAKLRQQGLDIQLQIAGEDEQGGTGYRKEIEQCIRDHQLSDYVKLLGAVSEEQNRHYIEQADLFVLASLNEGISVAVMEAMAMEIPVICTRVGGMHELIDSGVDGILVQPEQTQELVEAIANVLRNPDLATQLSQQARQKVMAKFDHRVGAKVLVQCLKSAQLV